MVGLFFSFLQVFCESAPGFLWKFYFEICRQILGWRKMRKILSRFSLSCFFFHKLKGFHVGHLLHWPNSPLASSNWNAEGPFHSLITVSQTYEGAASCHISKDNNPVEGWSRQNLSLRHFPLFYTMLGFQDTRNVGKTARYWVLLCPTFLSVRSSCDFVLYDLLKADWNWLSLTESNWNSQILTRTDWKKGENWLNSPGEGREHR